MDSQPIFNVHGKFLSEKINKVRWRPDSFYNAHFFITGSWDNDQNSIKLWDFQINEEESELYPFLLTEIPYNGDVTELKFINSECFVASSSEGSVNIFKIEDNSTLLKCTKQWTNLHKFRNKDPSPCTSLTNYNDDVASVGEDGCINLLNVQSKNIIRTFKDADSCSLQCVIFLKHNELLTSNVLGQMKIWDLRTSNNQSSSTFMLNSTDQITPTCLQYHPSQMHIIVAGDEEGSLTIWDLRQNNFPVNLLSGHEGSVSEIQFHPDHPDHFFSCSSAGDIWHWSPKGSTNIASNNSAWLLGNTNNKFEVFTLMPQLYKPINSLDLNKDKVIYGCDNEAMYLLHGLEFIN